MADADLQAVVFVVAAQVVGDAITVLQFQNWEFRPQAHPFKFAHQKAFFVGKACVEADFGGGNGRFVSDGLQGIVGLVVFKVVAVERIQVAMDNVDLVAEAIKPFVFIKSAPLFHQRELVGGVAAEEKSQEEIFAKSILAGAQLFEIVFKIATHRPAGVFVDHVKYAAAIFPLAVEGAKSSVGREHDAFAKLVAGAAAKPKARAFHRVETHHRAIGT